MRHLKVEEILNSRYGAEIYQAAKSGFSRFDDFIFHYGDVISQGYILDGQRIDEALSEFSKKPWNLSPHLIH